MELRTSSTIEIYNTYQDLYVTINMYTFKEGYTITTKYSKKYKKGEFQKTWM